MKRSIIVRTNAQLTDEHAYRRQWIVARSITKEGEDTPLPRREWLDAMSIAFANCQDIDIRNPDGTPFEIPYIDDVFSGCWDMRWMSYYLQSDESGLKPRRMSRKPDRLRLIRLFLDICYPKCSRHIDR